MPKYGAVKRNRENSSADPESQEREAEGSVARVFGGGAGRGMGNCTTLSVVRSCALRASMGFCEKI